MRMETIGAATLYLADCRDALPLISDVALVVTSPPYNQMSDVGKKPSGLWAQKSGGLGFSQKWLANGYTDDLPEAEYQAEQRALFALIADACRPDASLFYNHQIRWRDGEMLHPIDWFKPDNWQMRQEIIWDRAGGMMFNARMFCRFDERILWFVRSKKWKWNQESVGHGTIWHIPRAQNKEHPVAFPVELPARCIAATTDIGDVVLDPYAGSATTGVAAVQMGRKFIGIERDAGYFDIACRRIEQAQRQSDMFIESAA